MNHVVAVVGATGTGKSSLAIEIAHELAALGIPAEILGADAMQLYAGMDIGTAKLDASEQGGIPHHLLSIWPVTQEASVADYQRRANDRIRALHDEGRVPILCGGSGLYVSSVLFGFSFPGTDEAIRASLEARLADEGPAVLERELRAIDPLAADAIGPHNGRRIVRALEVNLMTGEPFSVGLPEAEKLVFPSTIVERTAPRDVLVQRLDERVLAMWERGMIDEVRSLEAQGLRDGVTARQAIGYAQALAQIDGELTESEAIESTQALTRRYARRQVSWFKRYPGVHLENPDASSIASSVRSRLAA
ncbi:tRNA (adenosine(37)-N6)-dimethylallyltransferase MiaA [Humidisolicoccus flavus]|uniref:tRNA (adenosine(37)-N6)-dimethylallyltransferase MiaA n=1 Tax=Humidisolicoccus flavus TaxID=3111414 RepID=UPI00325422A9